MNLLRRCLSALLVVLLTTPPAPAQAAPAAAPAATPPVCTGTDLLAELPAEERAQIDEAVARTPYARGIRYRATRDEAVIEIIGTYHFGDPRHDPIVAEMRPLIESAGALLVEAGPEEEERLTRALSEDPSLMIDTEGPTLPERLPDDEWEALGAAMEARGMPAIMASRLRPWYVAMMLGLSPCMIEGVRAEGAPAGLDHRLIGIAVENGTPIRALEPWDTLFRIFRDLTPEEELDMIRAALPAARLADDYAATTLEAYFRGDIWTIWEYGRIDAHESSGLPPETVERQMRLAEERLMTERNRSWVQPLTEAAAGAAGQGKPVVAAFGALHLPGDNGVLRLLESEGWTIEGGRE